jgi:hypothetical protein
MKADHAQEIEDWLAQPNINDSWADYAKKWVFDLMVHGSSATYKEIIDDKIENFYTLPGGTVLPVRSQYVGGVGAYVQIIPAMEPQLFFQDELSYTTYVPISSQSYGAIPIEALVNKVAESLLFDKLMAEQADGTRPPDKVVVFGDTTPFGGTLGEFKDDFTLPMGKAEQRRLEVKLNESKKGAIATLSGVGHPLVLDMTRENTMGVQMERQKMIREEVALVFNMSIWRSTFREVRTRRSAQKRITGAHRAREGDCSNRGASRGKITMTFSRSASFWYKIELQPTHDENLKYKSISP